MDQEIDIGSRLRQAREQRGLTLRDIAATTKISVAALAAIEQNAFDRLPGGVFRKGYLKAFAAEVGLDADEIAREYRARFEREPPATPLPRHEIDWKRRLLAQRLPVLSATIAGILICGALLLDRRFLRDDASDGDTPRAGEIAITDDEVLEADDSSDTAPVAVATAAMTDMGAPSLRLEIRTTALCWVSVLADGERAVYRLMQPGDRAEVEAHNLITLRVGDAGAVVYTINGAAGRPLGQRGEVVTIHLTSDNLESLYAKPESAFPAGGDHDST